MERVSRLAAAHVDWFLKAIRPLLIDNFVHGYAHGLENSEQILSDEATIYSDGLKLKEKKENKKKS